MHLNESNELHGEAFNFGPPAYQNHSVANLVTQMSQHWDRVHWQDISQKEDEPYESGLLKLNCDKALQHLKWHATWDFERTVQETIDWYRIFHEKPEIIAEQSKVQIRCYQQDAKNWIAMGTISLLDQIKISPLRQIPSLLEVMFGMP